MLKVIFISAILASVAWSRNDVLEYSIKETLNDPQTKARLGSFRFYFGKQDHPKVMRDMGEFKTNRKAGDFGKSDKEGCRIAFTEAMIVLKSRAHQEGGNAVINIHSYYRKNLTDTDSTFECGAGAMVAGVAFTGDVVQLSDSTASAADPVKPLDNL